MDEQQLELEDAIRSRLQRDLRRVPVAPYAHYRAGAAERLRPRARPMRAAGALLVGIAVIAMSLVVGSALGDLRQDVAATAPPVRSLDPTAGASTPTVAPSTGTTDPSYRDLFCGILSENTITTGQGAGPDTFELRPATSERTGAIGSTRFLWGDADRPALGTYVCVWLEQAVPVGVFKSRVDPGEPGYVDNILPNDFTLPQGCAFVGIPSTDLDGLTVVWNVDCGEAANREARRTLSSAFAEQNWIPCGSGLASATWLKGTSRLTVSEGSGSPGEYPKLTQRPYYYGGGAPSGAPGCS